MENELDLYYVIREDGYSIFDRNNPFFHIRQYEPYIPYKYLSYEDNAKWQIQFILEEHNRMKEQEEKLKKLEELERQEEIVEGDTNGIEN